MKDRNENNSNDGTTEETEDNLNYCSQKDEKIPHLWGQGSMRLCLKKPSENNDEPLKI